MHILPVGVTFNFPLLNFIKHINTIFTIIHLVCYTCKRTDYKQQYFYVNHLLIKILARKILLLIIAKLKNNASGRSLQLKKLNHPVPKGLRPPRRFRRNVNFPYNWFFSSLSHCQRIITLASNAHPHKDGHNNVKLTFIIPST